MPPTPPRVPVLYIAGAGRSGSTLLERLVAERTGFFGVGEMRYIWERGYLANELCSCATPFRSCPFWSGVLAETFDDSVEERVLELRAHLAYLLRIRRIPAFRLAVARSDEFASRLSRVLEAYGDLYATVRRRSSASVIVDSSKFATFGYLLAANPRLDVRVIHLVRDSRAVAHSWQRTKRRPEVTTGDVYMPTFGPRTTAKMWLEENCLCDGLRHHVQHSTLVRYEDLVSRPGVVEEVLEEVGLPSGVGTEADLEQRHSVSGNPSRLSGGSSEVRLDAAWLRDMSRRSKATVSFLTAPGLLRYGYALRPRA